MGEVSNIVATYRRSFTPVWKLTEAERAKIMGDVILFVPRPNPDRFAKAHEQVRFELANLVPFAKTGAPPEQVYDADAVWAGKHQVPVIYESSLGYVSDDNACCEINPDCA